MNDDAPGQGPLERPVGRLAPERCADCDLPNGCPEYCWRGAPSVEDAQAMGEKGGHAGDNERLAFEAWMRGHCWELGATWNGKGYISEREAGSGFGFVCPVAMTTRRMWAAWRDRAALARLKPPNAHIS